MSQLKKNFIPRNEGFVCEMCGQSVPPAKGTFRNHCPQCLTAKHVDNLVPGDRASTCQGPMHPIAIEGTNPDMLDIVHQCSLCQKIQRNRTAPDDSQEKILAVMKNRGTH